MIYKSIIKNGRLESFDKEDLPYIDEILKSVKEIGDYAFDRIPFNKTLVLPENIEYIGYTAFENCNTIETLVLPNSLKDISSSFLWNCPSLQMLVVPDIWINKFLFDFLEVEVCEQLRRQGCEFIAKSLYLDLKEKKNKAITPYVHIKGLDKKVAECEETPKISAEEVKQECEEANQNATNLAESIVAGFEADNRLIKEMVKEAVLNELRNQNKNFSVIIEDTENGFSINVEF